MRKLVSMREALTSDAIFGGYLVGPTWHAWRVLLIAIMGEPLTPDERVTFQALTGRAAEPTEAVREFWAVVGRRGGKSRATSVLGAYIAACCDHRAALAPGEVGVLPILAASTRQAQQLFNFVSGVFASVPRFAGLVNDQTGDTLRLKTGVNITVTPASWRTVRSITEISAIADEIAFWRSEDSVNPDEEIIGALKPSLLTTGGMLIGISSPYSQKGELFKAFRQHYGADGDPRKLVVKASSLTLNPSLPEDEIKLAYEEDPAKASAEYGGEFRRDIEAFVARDVIEAAVVDGRYELPPTSGVRYVAFTDPSGGSSDAMTLGIAHLERGNRVVLDALRVRVPPFGPDSVVQDFVDLIKSYRITKVVGDRYAGEWPRERFRVHGILYELSDRPASDIFRDALPLLNSGKVELLDHRKMIAELCNLERKTTRGGRDSISHPPRGHDDVAVAACGALIAAGSKRAPMAITPEILQRAAQPAAFQLSAAPVAYRPGESFGSHLSRAMQNGRKY